MKKNKIYATALILLCGAGSVLTSCVDTDSSLVDFGPQLNTPNDTIYSFMGVMNKMQKIADRTVVLGEVRGDLVRTMDAATVDLKAIADFTATADNRWNHPEDYYAVIQNCNYFLAHADTTLMIQGEKIFLPEYAAIKAFRAWTYLQLAIHYGKVPFYTVPLMTEAEADPALYPRYGVQEICEYFIKDLAPYTDTKYPSYVNNSLCIPVRLLLGDLCLWAGRYKEAATYYHAFLTNRNATIWPAQPYITASWTDDKFEHSPSYSMIVNPISYILLQTSEYDGIVSELDDVFTSTTDNRYYYQVTASSALTELSRSQRFVMVVNDPVTLLPDTISPPEDKVYLDPNMQGDLRLYSCQTNWKANVDGYNDMEQSILKLDAQRITLYRSGAVYLRMAEAYNRAGFPESAFAILKYGLYRETIDKYISPEEVARAGELLNWNTNYFTRDNTTGIHSAGCGRANADKTYVIPELASREDSILFVEEKICDEMALELVYEGHRFADLQRISLHRGDPEFLARKIAGRNGRDAFDNELYERLRHTENWYLPLE